MPVEIVEAATNIQHRYISSTEEVLASSMRQGQFGIVLDSNRTGHTNHLIVKRPTAMCCVSCGINLGPLDNVSKVRRLKAGDAFSVIIK